MRKICVVVVLALLTLGSFGFSRSEADGKDNDDGIRRKSTTGQSSPISASDRCEQSNGDFIHESPTDGITDVLIKAHRESLHRIKHQVVVGFPPCSAIQLFIARKLVARPLTCLRRETSLDWVRPRTTVRNPPKCEWHHERDSLAIDALYAPSATRESLFVFWMDMKRELFESGALNPLYPIGSVLRLFHASRMEEIDERHFFLTAPLDQVRRAVVETALSHPLKEYLLHHVSPSPPRWDGPIVFNSTFSSPEDALNYYCDRIRTNSNDGLSLYRSAMILLLDGAESPKCSSKSPQTLLVEAERLNITEALFVRIALMLGALDGLKNPMEYARADLVVELEYHTRMTNHPLGYVMLARQFHLGFPSASYYNEHVLWKTSTRKRKSPKGLHRPPGGGDVLVSQCKRQGPRPFRRQINLVKGDYLKASFLLLRGFGIVYRFIFDDAHGLASVAASFAWDQLGERHERLSRWFERGLTRLDWEAKLHSNSRPAVYEDYNERREHLLKFAGEEPYAHVDLGDLYLTGNPELGINGDIGLAVQHYQRAFEAGIGLGATRLGYLILSGEWPENTNLTEAKRLLHEGLALGEMVGALGLATHFFAQSNKTEALKLFELAGRHGLNDAYYRAGLIYHFDMDGHQNHTLARRSYQLAARDGHVFAALEWGKLLLFSPEGSDIESFQLIRAALRSDWTRLFYFDSARAMRRYIHLPVDVVRVTYAIAKEALWQREAEMSFAFLLELKTKTWWDSFTYNTMTPTAANGCFAKSVYERVILSEKDRSTSSEAHRKLGDCHWAQGGDFDERKAFEHYSKASLLGDDEATFNIARFYEIGIGGVRRNLTKAMEELDKVSDASFGWVAVSLLKMRIALGMFLEYVFG